LTPQDNNERIVDLLREQNGEYTYKVERARSIMEIFLQQIEKKNSDKIDLINLLRICSVIE
jgi:spore coat protein CotH